MACLQKTLRSSKEIFKSMMDNGHIFPYSRAGKTARGGTLKTMKNEETATGSTTRSSHKAGPLLCRSDAF